MPQKNIVCDSSALISLADTSHLAALKFLSNSGVNFFITPGVKSEITTRPMTIRRYALSAIRLQKCIDDGVIKLLASVTLHDQTQRILKSANSMMFAGKKPLELIQLGEAECLAIFASASAHMLLVDEKTTRLLIENPHKLRETIQMRNSEGIRLDLQKKDEFDSLTKGVSCLRSAELLAFAYSKGYFDDFRNLKEEAFKASVYALRDSGCGLSASEIVEYENMDF
ncbi:MAG: hypothetical protein WC408_01010 [Candidatus Micrarchaeia archaeon]|jgi:predicted nucleic acid-binding protein